MFFRVLFRVYVKSAENQHCRTADAPQRVIKHVPGFANPGTSSYIEHLNIVEGHKVL